MNKSLRINNLSKTYIVNKRQNNVLRNISFEIKAGEMVAIMGPSGSGKTTLLYAVSGMDNITAGEVDFFGKNIHDMSDKEISRVRLTEMGFVFQQMYLLKNLSIYDNIILPGYQKSNSIVLREEINEYARELMNKLGINEIAYNDINEVSGGQLQRACICRSMINKPKIIFADEPTGALNQQSSREVMKILNQINQEGTSIMIVTHDLKVASKCERIIYLEDGIIKAETNLGKYSEEIYEKDREKQLGNWLMEMGW